MTEKKLSEELRHCLEDDDCGDCQYHKPETKFICRGLLQKAYERVKELEEIEEKNMKLLREMTKGCCCELRVPENFMEDKKNGEIDKT